MRNTYQTQASTQKHGTLDSPSSVTCVYRDFHLATANRWILIHFALSSGNGKCTARIGIRSQGFKNQLTEDQLEMAQLHNFEVIFSFLDIWSVFRTLLRFSENTPKSALFFSRSRQLPKLATILETIV